jgi:hypothetical protein
VLPTKANLSDGRDSFAGLVEACETVGVEANRHPHRETGRAPADMLWRGTLASACLPVGCRTPTVALGQTRSVGDQPDDPVRFGALRDPDGHQGSEVWCRVVGDDFVTVASIRSRGHPDGSALKQADLPMAPTQLTDIYLLVWCPNSGDHERHTGDGLGGSVPPTLHHCRPGAEAVRPGSALPRTKLSRRPFPTTPPAR